MDPLQLVIAAAHGLLKLRTASPLPVRQQQRKGRLSPPPLKKRCVTAHVNEHFVFSLMKGCASFGIPIKREEAVRVLQEMKSRAGKTKTRKCQSALGSKPF